LWQFLPGPWHIQKGDVPRGVFASELPLSVEILHVQRVLPVADRQHHLPNSTSPTLRVPIRNKVAQPVMFFLRHRIVIGIVNFLTLKTVLPKIPSFICFNLFPFYKNGKYPFRQKCIKEDIHKQPKRISRGAYDRVLGHKIP
jgi:hypothetical protein